MIFKNDAGALQFDFYTSNEITYGATIIIRKITKSDISKHSKYESWQMTLKNISRNSEHQVYVSKVLQQ